MDNKTHAFLPDMSGFEPESLGASTACWFSPSYLLASRDLQEGEKLYAWLISAADGKLVEQVTFTADAQNRFIRYWPPAFAQAINNDGKHLKAGGWTDQGEFTVLEKTAYPEFFSILDAGGKSELNRFWYQGNDHRAFTSAPFNNNWVQAHPLSGDELNPGDVLWVQVRDITSQYLHECHIFVPPDQGPLDMAGQTSLCEQINSSSNMARAGRLDSGLIKADAQENALWVPQCSELAVTLHSVNWRVQNTVTANRDLLPNEPIYSFVLDNFSNKQLVEPHIFRPTKCEVDAWISEWATELQSSPLNNYLRVSDSKTSSVSTPSSTTQATLWQASAPIRAFTTEPSLENWVKITATLGDMYLDNQTSVTIRLLNSLTQLPLQEITFSPTTETVWDKSSWTHELFQYIFGQLDSTTQQYLRFGSDTPLSSTPDFNSTDMGSISLWVPRHSGIEADIIHETVTNPQQNGENLDFGNIELTLERCSRTQLLLKIVDTSSPSESYLSPLGTLHDRVETCTNTVTVWLGDDKTSYNTALVFRLSLDAIRAGVCFLSCSASPTPPESARYGYVLDLYMPETLGTSRSWGDVQLGYCNTSHLWVHSQSVPLSGFTLYEGTLPDSHLCNDYGNTYRSEVFDISGRNSTGVDPRTGLFNAFYPVATLIGLEGMGPVIDLGLHYSPTRANESGLGDGWAFNFSSYDIRPHVLTLSNGETVQLMDNDLSELKQGSPLKRANYEISATFKNNEIDSLTLSFISGRQEILSAPTTDDKIEPSTSLTNKIISKLNEAKQQFEKSKKQSETDFLQSKTYREALTVRTFKSSVTFHENAETLKLKQVWEAAWQDSYQKIIPPIDKELTFWAHPDLKLLPSKIIAPTGGSLSFDWEHLKGQYLLKTVSSGNQELLNGYYRSLSDSASTISFHIWPDTDEAYRVVLKLNNYLLKTLIRTEFRNNETLPLQEVQYGYSPDPTLDRVLTSVAESDGSREVVIYDQEATKFLDNLKPALPRVIRHMVQPGAGQHSLCTTWSYSEKNYLGFNSDGSYSPFSDSAVAAGENYLYSSTEEQDGTSTITRTWNGLHLQVQEVESEALGARKTTDWLFTSVAQGDPRFGLPRRISTTSQDSDLPNLQESAS